LAGFISAVALATILAVVSSLLIAGASSANDLVASLSGRQLDERMRLLISEFAAIALGVLGILGV
jgi:cation/acetate symporter